MEPEIEKVFNQLVTGSATCAIGNDLVFVSNFQSSLSDLFIKKVYTPTEITYCEQFAEPLLRYASTWAAKEAVYKAVKQLSPSPLSWKQIEIIREKAAGRPHVVFHADPNKFIISLTISHDGDYVWAAALASVNPTASLL